MLTRDQLEVLMRLEKHPEFQPFRDFLNQERQKARDHCESLAGDNLFRSQGAAQWIAKLQREMRDADQVLRKTSSRP
jgi:hypothetical protein